jgi:RNA-directed DNA polymerase
VNHLVEADIRGFFDAVNHEWLLKFLQQRIGDHRVLRLSGRMLKAGIMEDGLGQAAEEGTPQGSILSPVLSNVYLHFVLDLWFQRRVRRRCRGEAYLFRFAEDFLAGFQYQTDAEAFLARLGERLEGFHLELAEEKTRCLEFGRYARAKAYQKGGKPKGFDFLGMTFFCGKTRHGVFKVKRKTSRKKLRQSLARLTEWIRRFRNLLPTGELLRQAKERIQGHLNYYAITDNAESCQLYLHLTRRVLFKWRNRRSQRKSYTWDGFLQALGQVGWPQARGRVNLNPFARLNG